MRRGAISRIIPVILIVVIAIVAISALVALGRAIFSGGGTATTTPTDTSEQSLLNTSADHGVKMIIRGPIVADENFRTYTFDITPNVRTLTTDQGYEHTVLNNKALANNTPGYEQFVYALDKANLARGTAFTGEKDDIRGVCATGNVYEFDIYVGDSTVKHLWTSTCKGSPGSLDANVSQLQNLFNQQIPGSNAVIQSNNSLGLFSF